jgi:wyosine [tRNA(Phe)-imidazoG37] synthetase (radical SAM superfamily)
MAILFKDVVFGPVKSRRLGRSLGINPLPVSHKICSFNCVYCECGWTDYSSGIDRALPERSQIRDALEQRLKKMSEEGDPPDAITFAGNGEPTLHPQFAGIAEDALSARDKYSPGSKVAILSNATALHRRDVVDALTRFDLNILKLDCGTNEMFKRINNPNGNLDLDILTEQLRAFQGKTIIQTLFLRGRHNGEEIDNTRPDEFNAWLKRIEAINPEKVMIYSLDREPPEKSLEMVSQDELERLAEKIRERGITVEVF